MYTLIRGTAGFLNIVKMKIYFLSLLFLLVCATFVVAHGGEKHKKDSTSQADSAKQEHGKHVQGDTVHHHDEGMKPDQSKVTADLEDFPSLHPLIVHFAIVLIIVAAALQLLNVVLLKKELAWIIAAILLTGFLAAWFAAKDLHPHTHGLSAHAKLVLEQHDKFAEWTINTAVVALVLQISYSLALGYKRRGNSTDGQGRYVFTGKFKRGGAIVVAIVLVASSYCVARAGHYGAQLVHIEGIGPQGKFLEMEHEH